MKRTMISLILFAVLLTGCSNQNHSVTAESNPAYTQTTVTDTAAVTTTAITTRKPVYPTRTLDCVDNVTITVPEYPDCPLDALHFFDIRREIEGREPKEYILSVISYFYSIMTADNTKITELTNQHGVRIWRIVFGQGNTQTFYAAEKNHLYYFMEWKSDADHHIEDVLNEMQIDDSRLHYAYDPDNDKSDDTAYCYSQLSAEDRKIYDEIYQKLNPRTAATNPTWSCSGCDESKCTRLQRIVDGIYIDHDAESSYIYYLTKTENDVFTVYLEKQEPQLEKEKQDGYKIACDKADTIISAMPTTLTRFGKYVYLAKAVCDMIVYDDSGEHYYSYRIRGAFEDGRTLCTGYADTYSFLCQRAGLFCMNLNGHEHAWNGIRLNNELYHFDTTWMDADEGGYLDRFSHPFCSDEPVHEPYMCDFSIMSNLYPEIYDMILQTGSINWEQELTAPALK